MTILILGFISGVFMETCPTDDISPCQCEEHNFLPYFDRILVNCTSDVDKLYDLEILQQALSRLAGKDNVTFILTYFKIKADLPNFLSGIGIKELDLNDCRFDRLSNDDNLGVIDLPALGNDLEVRCLFSTRILILN